MKDYILSDVINELLSKMDIDTIMDYAFDSLYTYYDQAADEDEIKALLEGIK